jgi:hypothetical protein
MLVVQKDAGSILITKRVYYKDGGVGLPLKPGYALCYDHTEDLVPQAGEFDEMKRGIVCVRPATANLEHFAGIVVKVLNRQGTGTDFSGFVEIATPNAGSFLPAFCNVNATTGVTALQPQNGQFSLAADATAGIADNYSRRTAAVAMETKDTSVTPSNALVRLIGK